VGEEKSGAHRACGLRLIGGLARTDGGRGTEAEGPASRSGETTVAVSQVSYRGEGPDRVRLKLKNRAKLGPDVRGLYAGYRKRRGKTTTLTIFSLILRRAATTMRNTAPVHSPEEAAMIFFFVSAGFRDESVFEDHDEETDLFYKLVGISIGKGDETKPPKAALNLFKLGGIDSPSDDDPFDLGPNLIDTGHYDDGHSFGWNNAGTKQAIGDWLRLSANNAPYEEVIETIERRMTEDLNGDGEVGGKDGGTIETEVGAPVIH
jgi:hypothetical protein